MNAPPRIRLGDLLTQEGLLQPAQLTEALAIQKASGRKLGRIFVENGWVTEVQIAKTVARQLRVPYQDLSNASVRADVARLLPEGQARRLRAMVLETGGRRRPRGHGRPDRYGGLRRDRPPAQARGAAGGRRREPADAAHRAQLHGGRRHRRPGQGTHGRHGRRGGRARRTAWPEKCRRRGRAGGAPAAVGVRGGAAPPRLGHPHRAPAAVAGASASAWMACCTCRWRPTPRSATPWRCA